MVVNLREEAICTEYNIVLHIAIVINHSRAGVAEKIVKKEITIIGTFSLLELIFVMY